MSQSLLKHKYISLLIFSYFLLRLINLTLIPIFNDEAIYLDWGWRSLHNNVPFYSLFDGKQPFLMWLFGINEGIFSDQLFAGRLISVFAGAFTLIGLYRLGKEVFDRNVGLFAGIFYLVIPLFSFFDRQALMESAVAATNVWAIYFAIKLLKKNSFKNAIYLGVVVGVGFFIKSTILLLIVAFLLAYILVQKFKQDNKKFWLNSFVSIIVSQIVLLPLYLQQMFWQTLPMNDRYSRNIEEIFSFPVSAWLGNIWAFLQITFWQLTPLVFVSLIIGIVLIWHKGTKAQKLVLSIFLVQAFLFILIVKGINARYSMPILVLAPIIVGYLIAHFKEWNKWIIGGLITVPIYFLVLQLFQPLQYFDQLQSLTPYSQKDGYVTSSNAGYAVTQAVSFINDVKLSNAIVSVRLDAGNPENAIFTLFHSSNSRRPNYLDSKIIANVSEYQCLSYPTPVIFVARDTQLAGLESFLVERVRFYNPEHKSSVGIYAFKYPCKGKTIDLSAPGAILTPSK